MPRKSRKRKRSSVKEPKSSRPQKYRKWSEESMLGAIKAVADGRLGVNRAADQYGVPRTTLKDRMSGRHGMKSGPVPYLSYEEEAELVSYLFKCAEIGYPKTKDEVIGIVRKALQKKKGTEFSEAFKGKGWWARFVERWPKITLRRGDALSVSRAKAVTDANLKQYYCLLKKTLDNNNLLNLASRIYNMDETGMPLDHKPPKVVARKGMKKVHCHTSGSKGQITILACANAAGSVIPPMVIFEGQRFNPEWSKGEVPDTLYGMSEKGWTDHELFFYWITELFVKHIPPTRPVLLLVDGHSSHYEPDTIRAALEQGIVMFCLPPHCTHVAQPLDVSFFHPLKVYWSEACHKYMQENPGCVVTKYQFSTLFAKAWYKAIQPQNLISGFTKSGIYPYNPDAIKAPVYPTDMEDKEGSDSDGEQDTEDVGDNGETNVVTMGDNGETNLVTMGDIGEMDMVTMGYSDTVNDHEAMSSSFTPEQIALFELRHQNKYNLYIDYDYVSWLIENHPEDVPPDVFDGVCDLQCENGTLPKRFTLEDDLAQPLSISHSFCATPAKGLSQPGTSTPKNNMVMAPSTLANQSTKALSTSPRTPAPAYQLTKAMMTPPVTSALTNQSSEIPLTPPVTSTLANELTKVSSTPPVTSTLANQSSKALLTPPITSTVANQSSEVPSTPPVTSTLANQSSKALLTPPMTSFPANKLTKAQSTPSVTCTPGPITTPKSKRKPLSSLTGLLNYPTIPSTSTKRKTKESNGPRVLTSAEAIALMEEKERKKKEEEQAKEQRKKEREEKKVQREAEKRQKAEERVRKQEERKKKAEEKAEAKRKKAEARRKKAEEREAQRQCKAVSQTNKENRPSRKRDDETGLQGAEISSSECAVCFGLYEDDLVDGQLSNEWIQCPSTDCGKWMHISCLNTNGEMFICHVCKDTFC